MSGSFWRAAKVLSGAPLALVLALSLSCGSSGDAATGANAAGETCSADADCQSGKCATTAVDSNWKYCSKSCQTTDDCVELAAKMRRLSVPEQANAQFGDPVTNHWGSAELNQGLACNAGVCQYACVPNAALAFDEKGAPKGCECLPNFKTTPDKLDCEWSPGVGCSILSYYSAADITKLALPGVPKQCDACNSNHDATSQLDCHTGLYGCDFTSPGRLEGECTELITADALNQCTQPMNFNCSCREGCIKNCMSADCVDVCCSCADLTTPWKAPVCSGGSDNSTGGNGGSSGTGHGGSSNSGGSSSATCPFANDGMCDEPGKGSGLCPAGSDPKDCGGS